MLKKYLITPGPTAVPEQVLLDMARPMIHHRTPEFEAIFKEARNGLKKVFILNGGILFVLKMLKHF